MSAEKPDCLRILGRLANLIGIRDRSNTEILHTRFVKTKSGAKVELQDEQPDEIAEGIARTYRTGKATVGHLDEATGKFIIEEVD